MILSAEINGPVTDGSGANLPTARVTLENLDRHVSQTAPVTSSGKYVFPALSSGTIKRFKHAALKAFVVPEFTLGSGDGMRQDETMQVGALTERVELQGQAPALKTDSSTWEHGDDPGSFGSASERRNFMMKTTSIFGAVVCSAGMMCLTPSHVVEATSFTNVTAQQGEPQKPVPIKRSKVSVYDLKNKSVSVVYAADQMIEAPNWSPDGKYLLVNSKGDLWKLPVGGTNPETQKIDLGSIRRCNNDKGFSPDGKLIAFSSGATGHGSQVYRVRTEGGTPKMVVSETPSYFHAFSPDGKWLAVVAQRNNNFDLFRLPVEGGEQQRLTSNPGYDDGPDYSPDGKWIYFNSDRSGKWEIWRMPADGAGPDDKAAQQVTRNQDEEDWFPHCSPDGKWLVFIAFPKGTAGHNGHLNVKLEMVRLPGKHIKHAIPQTLTEFFGGQGTINVNSWAPDASKLAFVSYER